jgi:hypothetical protein
MSYMEHDAMVHMRAPVYWEYTWPWMGHLMMN